MTFRFLFAALTLAVSVPAIAQVPIIQPGLPGQPSRQISAEEASDLAGLQFSEADVRFMQGMISHHRQAMEMSVLVDDRSNREAVEALAERISLSQEDEISMMAGWLEDRGFEAPAADAHHDPDYMLMPGMLSPEEMEQLEAAEGFEFDSLFLNFMIDHHEGALVMVENLLDQPGSAQDSELYRFTTDVTSDQTSEIERMITMLSGFSPDPRVALTPGFRDAGEAALNMRLVASLPKPDGFFDPANPSGLPNRDDRDQEETLAPDPDAPDEPVAEPVSDPAAAQNVQETPVAEDEEDDEDSEPRPSLLNFGNTDLVFTGNVLVAGNYHGYNAYDISNPIMPQLLSSVVCPGGQGDVSIVGDLLIMSVEQTRGRLDCGLQGVAEPESDERFRGIRIFDVSDFRMPMQVGAVQTCRGSHTHTVVTDPDDAGNIYVYGSGTSFVRDEEELAGCSDESPFENPESSLYSIDVIRIPVDAPGEAAIVNRPFIFSDPETGVAAGLWEGGDHGPDTQETRMTNQCHDITAFPEIGLAAGACSGNGILLDISDAENPERVDEVIDPGFAYWHSATFNNDGTKVIFTDEWGGGGRPRCRASDPLNWGADAIYDIVDGQMEYRSHYKMSAPQTETENCVAHNGSLVPVPGRDIFVQAWYQGGVSVVDFTDSANPVEIAFFDRGPIDEEELISGGYWSTYFYNGYIYGTEIARGLDVLQLQPSDFLTENEIAAASLPHGAVTFNAQQQTMFRWPAEPVVARAYLDQLARSESLSAAQRQDLSEALDEAQDALDSGADNNAVAGRLEDLAEEYESASASGVDASRLAALADTLTGIADRL
ncbi:MAG: DUF305 domain-containing protein [Gammaproteobacteria bacterium]|nr:DUF305 domain-containing protein [Gammaproteobacteria bacterium]MYC60866.1 DUF305 domain-containing protein [Gammaproteobacteria bacterium]MYH45239.1 DUF305 domain-containing protein [Gammaproteobacteria bacterium]MYL12477.1 DUF305 domain-containing protein [Gammaproteobacteria bacterium]